MSKKFTPYTAQDAKISHIRYKDKKLDYNKVDINILLNRVKFQKVEARKKNIIFVICALVGLGTSAYLIF
jgi:hypothetical protein